MLKSMTGYGEGLAENANYRVKVTVKTVNQRYLDINFHTPALLSPLEGRLRALIKERVARGKLDLYVSVEDLREKGTIIRVNKPLALAYQRALGELSTILRLTRLDDVSVLAGYEGVLAVEQDTSFTDGMPVLEEALQKALAALEAMRQTEGEHLQKDLRGRLTQMEELVEAIKALAPEITLAYRERLQEMLQELLADQDIEEHRLIQETAIYADKVNFTEEVVRLASHFAQFRSMLAADGPIGRKMDFLIQEMNREANTIGSKANSAKAAQLVVDLKSEIEKMREQVQNIE